MGSRSEYHCNNCDKDWVEDKQMFYLMSDDRIEEQGIIMLSYQIQRRSIAHGWISDSYCKICDKHIKLYLLEEVKTHYPNLDPNRILEEYKHNPNFIFGTYNDFKDGQEVDCPNCNNKIVLEEDFNLGDEYNLNCNSYHTSCESCGEDYNFFAIKPPLRNYTQKEVLEKLENLLDEYSILALSEDYESITEIKCPCCGNEIPKQISYDKCPKCGGELEGGLCILYD